MSLIQTINLVFIDIESRDDLNVFDAVVANDRMHHTRHIGVAGQLYVVMNTQGSQIRVRRDGARRSAEIIDATVTGPGTVELVTDRTLVRR